MDTGCRAGKSGVSLVPMMDSIAFKTLKRPNSPNTYLLAPENLCDQARPDKLSEVLHMSPAELYAALIGMIETHAGWSLESSDEGRGQIHFVSTSTLMKFKDDVDILVMPAEAGDPNGARGARLAIYSRSRVGHSDLGANRKRVNAMLARLNKMQVKT